VNHSNTPSLLFHRPEFIFRNGAESIFKFEVQHAHIYFTRNNNALTSLEKAPFGGFIVRHDASDAHLISLIQKVDDWSQTNNIDNLTIRCCPEVYDEKQSTKVNRALMRCGFEVKYHDVTQVIPVSGEMHLNMDKKRRIRKSFSSGFTFSQLGLNLLFESYSLIVQSRKQKQYPVTMTREDVERMFTLFPEDYLLFGVFEKSKMIATAVCIKVNAKILYCFYIGDDIAYRSYSPVTFLIHGIHEFCRLQEIELLDLGISTDRGKLNQGLYTFKKSFGGFDSRKLTFEKKL
jgi:hypothetical protein